MYNFKVLPAARENRLSGCVEIAKIHQPVNSVKRILMFYIYLLLCRIYFMGKHKTMTTFCMLHSEFFHLWTSEVVSHSSNLNVMLS